MRASEASAERSANSSIQVGARRHLPPVQAPARPLPCQLHRTLGAECPAIGLREHLRCSSCRDRMANPHNPARSRSSHEGARDAVGIEEAAVHIMNAEEHS